MRISSSALFLGCLALFLSVAYSSGDTAYDLPTKLEAAAANPENCDWDFSQELADSWQSSAHINDGITGRVLVSSIRIILPREKQSLLSKLGSLFQNFKKPQPGRRSGLKLLVGNMENGHWTPQGYAEVYCKDTTLDISVPKKHEKVSEQLQYLTTFTAIGGKIFLQNIKTGKPGKPGEPGKPEEPSKPTEVKAFETVFDSKRVFENFLKMKAEKFRDKFKGVEWRARILPTRGTSVVKLVDKDDKKKYYIKSERSFAGRRFLTAANMMASSIRGQQAYFTLKHKPQPAGRVAAALHNLVRGLNYAESRAKDIMLMRKGRD